MKRCAECNDPIYAAELAESDPEMCVSCAEANDMPVDGLALLEQAAYVAGFEAAKSLLEEEINARTA